MSLMWFISEARRIGLERPSRTPFDLVAPIEVLIDMDESYRSETVERAKDRDGNAVIAAENDGHGAGSDLILRTAASAREE